MEELGFFCEQSAEQNWIKLYWIQVSGRGQMVLIHLCTLWFMMELFFWGGAGFLGNFQLSLKEPVNIFAKNPPKHNSIIDVYMFHGILNTPLNKVWLCGLFSVKVGEIGFYINRKKFIRWFVSVKGEVV